MQDDSVYTLYDLVEEIMRMNYSEIANSDIKKSDYQRILDYFNRLKEFIGIDLDKTTIHRENKNNIVRTIQCLMDTENNGYYKLMKKIIDGKKVDKDEASKLYQVLNELLGIKIDNPVMLGVNKKYNEMLNVCQNYFSFLMQQIQASSINEAEKYNILVAISNEIIKQGKQLQKSERNVSMKRQNDLSQRSKQNIMLSQESISELMISILLNVDSFPEKVHAKTSEQSYIQKYFKKIDFVKASELHNDILAYKIKISSIENDRVKEIYIRAYPDIYNKEQTKVDSKLLKELI